jgi:hypothetical protein
MDEKKVNPHFISLIMMLGSAAWQQLGKVPNPMTGKVEKEIANAQITIDLMAMLRDKTKGNLMPDEERLLTNTLSDLQLNYADEVSKEQESGQKPEEKKEEVKPS